MTKSRHTGEGRYPVFKAGMDGSITNWTPAFAGVTAQERDER